MDRKSFLRRMAAGALACAMLELDPIAEPVETEELVELNTLQRSYNEQWGRVLDDLEPDTNYEIRARYLEPDGEWGQWSGILPARGHLPDADARST